MNGFRNCLLRCHNPSGLLADQEEPPFYQLRILYTILTIPTKKKTKTKNKQKKNPIKSTQKWTMLAICLGIAWNNSLRSVSLSVKEENIKYIYREVYVNSHIFFLLKNQQIVRHLSYGLRHHFVVDIFLANIFQKICIYFPGLSHELTRLFLLLFRTNFGNFYLDTQSTQTMTKHLKGYLYKYIISYIYISISIWIRPIIYMINLCEEINWTRQNLRRKGKTEEKYVFDGLFICQRVSTSIFYFFFFFFLIAKIFWANYFRERNYHDR